MATIIIIICIVVFIFATISKRKIDDEEKVLLKTPGEAVQLWENYGKVLEFILRSKDHKILFERSYDQSVKIGNSHNQELFLFYTAFGAHGPELRVACTQDSMLLKEWVFDKRRTSVSIYNEITNYFL